MSYIVVMSYTYLSIEQQSAWVLRSQILLSHNCVGHVHVVVSNSSIHESCNKAGASVTCMSPTVLAWLHQHVICHLIWCTASLSEFVIIDHSAKGL